MARVGRNIQILRNRKKMTQNDLAEKIFVSRQTISNYENGKSNPDIEMLLRIAEVLECDANTLIYGIPAPQDRKKDYWKLGMGAGVLLLLGLAVLWLTPIAEEYFIGHLVWLIKTLLFPVFYLVCGWTCMQLFSVYLGLTPPMIKKKRKLWIGLVALLAILFAVMLPYQIYNLVSTVEQLQLINNRIGFEYSGAFQMPGWYELLIYRGAYFIYKYNYIFVVPGMLLWILSEKTKRTVKDDEKSDVHRINTK